MEKMLIRQQNLEEMKEIYHGMLARHFPSDEIKPFSRIKESYEKGEYVGYGLYEDRPDAECLAYAWLCRISSENWILLDYYAVTEKLRGQGMGSWFLKRIFEKYSRGMSVIIEVEDPDRIREDQAISLEEEREKRLRRMSFYLKNGVKQTELRASVFQIPYSIMVYFPQDSEQSVVSFDRESLKRAYYYFYSRVPWNVKIGEMHEIEQQ